MKKLYRWVIEFITVITGFIILSGCTPQQADLSGTYYYVQNFSNQTSYSDGNKNMVHKLVINKTPRFTIKLATIVSTQTK